MSEEIESQNLLDQCLAKPKSWSNIVFKNKYLG